MGTSSATKEVVEEIPAQPVVEVPGEENWDLVSTCTYCDSDVNRKYPSTPIIFSNLLIQDTCQKSTWKTQK